MSKDREKRRHERSKAPPMSRIPENMGNMAFFGIEELRVGSWCESPNGKGPMTQVHLRIKLLGCDIPLLMRFKSPNTLDQLIETLARHRADVWPTPIDKESMR